MMLTVYHKMDSNVINCVYDGNSWDTIANIITTFVGVMNLIFIVVIYFKDKKDNKNKEIVQAQKEQEKQEKEYKYSWYKMINVSERINELNNIMDQVVTSYNLIFNIEDNNIENRKVAMKIETGKVDKMLKNEKSKFTSILKSLNEEENRILSKMYNDFQDEYLNYFTMAVAKTDGDLSVLQSCLTNIISKYYELGHDILNIKK